MEAQTHPKIFRRKINQSVKHQFKMQTIHAPGSDYSHVRTYELYLNSISRNLSLPVSRILYWTTPSSLR